ncbi:MAG: PEP-utilizing enzyme, partial [Thermodesulfobacteriota bacterium]
MKYEASPYEFDEELDLAFHPAWFVDELHGTPVPDYVSSSWVAEKVTHGFCHAAEYLSLPRCKGILWRNYKNIRLIITPKVVESESEVAEREAKFRENLNRLINDFGPMWEEYKKELVELYRPFKEFDLKKATNMELAKKIDDLRQAGYRMCEIHFWGMYGSWSLFMLFREFCEGLGIDVYGEDFNNMIRGHDNDSFRSERGLYRLSRRVLELNLSSIFELSAEGVIPRLEKEPLGREWLKEFKEYMNKYGWKCLICWWITSPSWIEDPKYAIEKVKEYLKLKEIPKLLDIEKAATERERSIKKIRAQIPEDKRKTFDLLLSSAHYADIFSEEHNLYCEFPNDSIRRHYMLELGRRFVEAGTIDNINDIFYLWIDEVKKIAYWPERWRLQKLIKERKMKSKDLMEKPIPPVVTKELTPEQAFEYMMRSRDPILIYTIVGEIPKPKPELKADIIGVSGATGIAEGPARVVFTDTQLSEIRPGKILVCPTTTITWTTAFSLVKGVVVDRGGILSHAAIVSRQFGIPCVINTFVGTSKIKTGQRIKVDGNRGAIYL